MPTLELYHGTSSIFLNSIREHGLQPFPIDRIYNEWIGGQISSFSKHSLGGIYLTNKKESAKHCAEISCNHKEGDPIIFTVNIDSEALIADEDEIEPWIHPAFEKIAIYLGIRYDEPEKILAIIDSNESQRKYVESVFFKEFHSKIENGEEYNQNILSDIFYAALRLKCYYSFSYNNNQFQIRYQSFHASFQPFSREPVDQWFGSMEIEESRFQTVMDDTTKHYRKYIDKMFNDYRGIITSRTLKPISWNTTDSNFIIKFESSDHMQQCFQA